MKLSSILFISLFLFPGCGKKTGTGGGGGNGSGGTAPNPPTNLTITAAGSDSLSLKLNWNASTTSGIEKYLVCFNSSNIAEVTTTSYTYKPSALGDYKIAAYKDGKTSSFSNIVSTQLVKDSAQGPIHISKDPRGYGWDSTGSGEIDSIGNSGKQKE